MNSMTRFLAMAGMGVVAAVTMAGPAQAAAAADTTAAKRPSAVKHWDNDRDRGRDHVVRYYSPRQAWKCHVDGRRGERFGIYRDYDCERVRFGPRRGMIALEVEYSRRGGGFGNSHHNNGFGGFGR